MFCIYALIAVSVRCQYTKLGSFDFKNPAFAVVLNNFGDSQETSLFLTTFSANPFTKGTVAYVPSVDDFVSNISSSGVTTIGPDFTWPNIVSAVPKGALPNCEVCLIVPDGFLVPGKSTGNIYLVYGSDMSQSVSLAESKSEYFYHMVEWRDMNGDGRLDILTARATKPVLGSAGGEMIWLEQPAENPFTNVPWNTHVVTQGPEFIFKTANYDPSGETFQVFAGQFFTQKLVLYNIDSKTGVAVSNITVDNSSYAFEDVHLVDLNSDGKAELLVNSHEGDGSGGIYAYEIHQHGNTDFSFDRHVIAQGFPVTEKGFAQAAPGFITPFPTLDAANSTSMLVGGDGSQSAYLLTPTSTPFVYNLTTIVKVNGVIGVVPIATLQNATAIYSAKGKASVSRVFFVPDYDEGIVFVYALDN